MTYKLPERIFGSAAISTCGQYRYELTRSWDATRPTVAFVMLNPSTADACDNDPTIRKCIGFADRWGYGELRVYNLFALRATDPAELAKHADPVGPDFHNYINRPAECAKIVCAWGSFDFGVEVLVRARRIATTALAGLDLYALAVNQDGNPRHPLYVPNITTPVLWRAKA